MIAGEAHFADGFGAVYRQMSVEDPKRDAALAVAEPTGQALGRVARNRLAAREGRRRVAFARGQQPAQGIAAQLAIAVSGIDRAEHDDTDAIIGEQPHIGGEAVDFAAMADDPMAVE